MAKNEQFVELALKLAKHIASLPDNANKSGTGEDIKDQAYFEDASTSVGDLIKSAIARIGENIQPLEGFRAFLYLTPIWVVCFLCKGSWPCGP